MALTELTIEDVGPHGQSVIPLGRLTVLVGPTGSGKTSVLGALQILSRAESWADDDESGKSRITLAGTGASLWLIQWPTPHRGKTEMVGSDQDTGADGRGLGLDPRDPPVSLASLPPTRLRRLAVHPALAASASITAPNRKSVDDSGKGLASMLFNLSIDDPSRFRRVMDAFLALFPQIASAEIVRATEERQIVRAVTVDNRVVTGTSLEEVAVERLRFKTRGGVDLGASALSPAMLSALVLLTMLVVPEGPRLVTIDDFDRELHPAAARALLVIVREVLAEQPDLQVVVTTTSTTVLTALQPGEMVAMAIGPDGTHSLWLDAADADRARIRDALESPTPLGLREPSPGEGAARTSQEA